MAGRGSRFKKQGIDEEKHRLKIKDKTMFEWAMKSLEDFFDEEFVFISRKENDDSEFIKQKCDNLGIENREVVEITGVTDGQATTVLEAEEKVDEKEEIAIYNIDTYIEEGEILKKDVKGDGHIPVFKAPGEKWSFVKTNRKGKVTEVAEKKRISELATVGFYHFGSLKEYRKAYSELGEQVKEEYGEKYIAPLYQWFIDNQKDLTIQRIESEKVHVLGTPEDVIEFWPMFRNHLK